MEDSKFPFKTWYLIMMLMSSTKKGFSASEIQRQVGHSRCKTIRNIVHKLRLVMGKGEDLYKLSDIIEFYEGHFEVETKKEERSKLKRGKRGSASETSCSDG